MRQTLAAAAAWALISASAAAQEVRGSGEALFESCRSCHSLDPAEGGKAGPHLAGLSGRIVASAEGFDYSPSLKAGRARGLAWDTERLKAYLADPDAMFPGSWMSAPGVDTDADRSAIAAFLLGR